MREAVLSRISDLCSDFLYYDRKEDKELGVEELNNCVRSGEITVDEMVAEFRRNLEQVYKD